MTASVAAPSTEQNLLDQLRLVDESRVFAQSLEDRYITDVESLYAEQASSTDSGSPLLTAALLSGLVLVIRRAFSAGAAEGARFAQTQFDALELPSALLGEVEFVASGFDDKLVADFLSGQVEVARNPSKERAVTAAELLKRAKLAVVSAVQAGRGLATEQQFQAVASLLGMAVHKLWVARFDLDTPPCAMCVRLHGRHVPVKDAFEVLKNEPPVYRPPLSAPPRHPQCRCSLVLFMPDAKLTSEVTPLSMQSYGEWMLTASAADRENLVAATIVHVKAYTRMVDGRLQQVSGYYYNIQTGQKVPAGAVGSMKVKEVSAGQAKSMAKVSKVANQSTPKGGAPDLSWKPGTYKVDNPGDDDTQIVVHQDGSSTAIWKGQTEDNDKAKTSQYLSVAKQQGKVQKISDDPEVPDPDGPGPVMEPDAKTNKESTLAEGFYMLPDSSYGGVRVNPDGSGELYSKDFSKSFKLGEVAVNQISNGNLGSFDEVDEKDFKSDWQKSFDETQGKKTDVPSTDAPGAGTPETAETPDPVDRKVASPESKEAPDPETGGTPDGESSPNAPDFAAIPDKIIPGEPALPSDFKNMAAGIAVIESDGSVWIYEPKGQFAGYEHTWPKGGTEDGLTIQQVAHKELFEETGITADITGYLGDFKRSGPMGAKGGKVRMYVATRLGGTPLPDDPTPYEKGGNETASVKKVSFEEAKSLLNVNRDKRILKDVVQFGTAGRAPAQAAAPAPAPNAPTAPSAPAAPAAPSAPAAPKPPVPEAPAAPQTPTKPAPAPRTPPETPSSPAPVPAALKGGPGGVVAGGPSLFSVGGHSVQIEEGSQVYRSSKSKDTLYVLQPDGDLIKYNPQGAGVQATKVGSSDNPAARAAQLSKLGNVSDDGVSIKDSVPAPGTGKAWIGGFEMTSVQLSSAIAALSSNPSGNVVGDLKKVGSPLAAGNFHAVAAPYKAYHNNKTKPALIAALKKAQQQTGTVPSSEAPAVAHMETAHGLTDHHAQLGHADTEAIHAALHAADPAGSDHSHANDGPGFISVDGVPLPPATVAQAIEALKASPSKETGVKKPLKAAGSPLSGLDLQRLVNESSVTESFKGSNGKVHYGKMKPAVLALLTDALDKHQTKNPPTPLSAPAPPPVLKSVAGVSATQAEILEIQNLFNSVDLDTQPFPSALLAGLASNPLAFGVEWGTFAKSVSGDPTLPKNKWNKAIFDGLNAHLDIKTRGTGPVAPEVPEDSPSIQVGETSATVKDLKAYRNWAVSESVYGTAAPPLPASSPFKDTAPEEVLRSLGGDPAGPQSLAAALDDAVQAKLDNVALRVALPPPTAPGSAEGAVSVGGKQVTKSELLAAIEAVKNSPSTGVKGPLKEIDSPLSKVDIKAYVEGDALSAPFKGKNGKVHYGKLKEAVVAVLQAKADGLSVPEPRPEPGVTPADAAPETDAPDTDVPDPFSDTFFDSPVPTFDDDSFFEDTGVTPSSGEQSFSQQIQTAWQNAQNSPDINSDNPFAVAFQAAVKNNQFWYANENYADPSKESVDEDQFYEISPDGIVSKSNFDGELYPVSDSEVLEQLDGSFSSAPGLEEDLSEDNLPEPGFYTAFGISLKVYPDGSGLIRNLSQGDVNNIDSPQAVKNLLATDSWQKLADTPDEVGVANVSGLTVGKYTISGMTATVLPSGQVYLKTYGGDSVMDAELAKNYIQGFGVAPSATHKDPPQWLMDAPKGPKGLLQGTYTSLIGDKYTVSEDDIQDQNGNFISPAFLASSLFSDDASFQRSSPLSEIPDSSDSSSDEDAPLPNPWEFDEESPTDFDPPVESTPGFYTDEYSGKQYQIGTYTNGEGQFLEIKEDEIFFENEDGEIDPVELLDMIDSGDLTFVPRVESPVPSTPQSLVDVDAPVLKPFLNGTFNNFSKLDKSDLFAAVTQWASESGFEGVVAQHLNNSTSKEDLTDWLIAWSKGEWDKAFAIESKKVKKHKKSAEHPGSPDNPVNFGGFTKKKMPPLVSGEIPAGTAVPGSWPVDSPYAWTPDQADAYLLAANMQNPTGLDSYQKKKWAFQHSVGNKISVDFLSSIAQKNVASGKIYSAPILPQVQKYSPGQVVPLPPDFPPIDFAKSAVKDWSNNQLDFYLNHVGTGQQSVEFLAKQSPETKAQLVSLHAVAAAPSDQSTFKDPALAKQQMQDILDKVQYTSSWNEAETTSFIQNLTKVDGKTFTKNESQPPLGGGSSSEIIQVSDQDGNPFLFKVSSEKFRAEVEHAGHELAQLAGVKIADSQLGTFEGKFGQFQAKIPSKSTLKYVPVEDLPLSALKDLMAAHVQDWATANDDAHGDNFLLTEDGKRAIPIDIARSFVRFGKPGTMQLKVGALSDWTTPYYDKVYKAALSKGLSDADVDELYRSSIKQAKRTAGVSDSLWGDTISKGLKNRPNLQWTSAKDLPDLVGQAIARKNALPEDFEKFWDEIYSQMGREKPQPPKGIAPDVFSGFTPDFIAKAEVMGNHGAATFFGGTDLEEGSMLGQVMEKQNGGKEFHLTGQLRKDADSKLRSWLASNLSSDLSGLTPTGSGSKQQFIEQSGAESYSSYILAAAKTISHHHSKGDRNYNSMHIANYESMKADVTKKLSDAYAGKFPTQFKDWPEAQQEYMQLLDYYDGKLKAIQQLMDFNGQSKFGDFDPYSVNVPPPKAIASPIDLGDDLKVTKIASYYDRAKLNDDGKLVLDGQKADTGQSGKTYQVTLSDGTEIEYRSWASADGVRTAQQGQLRIKVREFDGTSAGLDSARSALSKMGVDFNDASEEDLELFYYRHLYGVATSRKDSNSGKLKEVIDDVKANLPGGGEGTPALDAAEELKRWRNAWSRLDPKRFNTFLADKKWMPQFSRVNPSAPEERGGQPYWDRFDFDDDWLKDQQFLTHSLYDSSVALNLIRSGGLFSTEDRTKLLGQWSGGMSSTSDQSHGSSNFVFTRLNQETNGAQVLLSPRVLKRTTNYGFNGDYFGEIKSRSTNSYFDSKNMVMKNTAGSNELLIKRGVSFLDDIELLVFPNEAMRQEAISYLKSKGITTIRGLPITERLVLQSNKSAALKKLKEHNKTWTEED